MKRGLSVLFVFVILVGVGMGQTVTAARRGKIIDAILQKNDSLRKLPFDARAAQVVAFMKTFKEINYTVVSKDRNISCGFIDFVPFTLMYSSEVMGIGMNEEPKPPPVAVFRGPNAELSLVENWLNLPPAPFLQSQHNDLPDSLDARVANALGNAYENGAIKVRKFLENAGYKVAAGEKADVETLRTMGVLGVFYMDTHGGNGIIWNKVTKKWDQEYILTTGTEWTQQLEDTYRNQSMFIDGYMGDCGAGADRDPRTGKIIDKRYFTISKKFISRYWRFSKNGVCVITACTGFRLAETITSAPVNASAYAGNNDLGISTSTKNAVFEMDRLCGSNTTPPDETGWPQRPFDYIEVDKETKDRGMWPVTFTHEGKNHSTTLAWTDGAGNFGLLSPSIRNLEPVPYALKLQINGIFGEDPGDANRSVKIGGVAVVVDKWEPNKIIVILPPTEQGTEGEVVVYHKGRQSNSRWLSSWKGDLGVTLSGEGSLSFNAVFHVRFVGDPWNYREHAGQKPVDPFVWNVFSSIGSTCEWRASGEHKNSDGRVLHKWDGNGNPKSFNPESTNFRGTFAVGGVGDSYQKLINVSFMINESFTYTDGAGPKPNTPIKLGDFMQGQSLVQMKVDTDKNLLGDTKRITNDPTKVSYGGHTGIAKWNTFSVQNKMPNNAAR